MVDVLLNSSCAAMNSKSSDDRLRDRPRLEEALAKLREGLNDDDDPFYDGWRHRKRPVPPAAPTALAVSGPQKSAPDELPPGAEELPVRVVSRRGFPGWALVLTAALGAFSISLVVLRLACRHRVEARAATLAPAPAAFASAAQPASGLHD